MTTPTRHRRRGPSGPPATAPGREVRPLGNPCCRAWSNEHISPGGLVVRTTWHEPACATWGRR
ncbi:hypothetical protein ACFXPX_32725 [Kitasatospora sp. NPDC059146]|uniref:hypothetical protein n=1 Tax=unclassified Kitasatospora TaxID=2633591 RepID=UPI0036AB1B53